MALPEHVTRHAPKQSWWLQPDRESFQKAKQAEESRMRLVGCYVQLGFKNESKHANTMTTLPKPRRDAE